MFIHKFYVFLFFNDTTTTEIYTLSLHDALPICVKHLIFLTTALVAGAVVAVSGLIGFVGMVVPHAMRMVLGADHRLLLPAAALFGGVFLMVADTVARSLLAPTELPVGVITALCGGPFFIYLLIRHRGARML